MLDELLCSVSYSLQMKTMSIIYFKPIMFANKVIALFMLNNFDATPQLQRKIQAGIKWRLGKISKLSLSEMIDFSDQNFEFFVDYMVSKFSTLFMPPEEKACEEGTRGNSLNIIVAGYFTTHFGQNDRFKDTLLLRGDHFGEIGLLFDCDRTCTVQSIDYAILARLTKERLPMILSDNPLLLEQFYKHVYAYEDEFKNMMLTIFSKIDYLSELPAPLFHRIIYAFEQVVFEENEIVLRQFDVIDSLLIVQRGQIEVIMHVDGFDMVVARLGAGTCLNHRNFVLVKRKMFLSVRCSRRAAIMILSNEKLDTLMQVDAQLSKKVEQQIEKLEKDNIEYLLDFLPNCTQTNRKARLQNVVMQILLRVRSNLKKISIFE